jgi:hypothetical protein
MTDVRTETRPQTRKVEVSVGAGAEGRDLGAELCQPRSPGDETISN